MKPRAAPLLINTKFPALVIELLSNKNSAWARHDVHEILFKQCHLFFFPAWQMNPPSNQILECTHARRGDLNMITMRKFTGLLGTNTFQGIYLFIFQACPRLRIGSDRSQMLL